MVLMMEMMMIMVMMVMTKMILMVMMIRSGTDFCNIHYIDIYSRYGLLIHLCIHTYIIIYIYIIYIYVCVRGELFN